MMFVDFVNQHDQVLFQHGRRKQALDLAKLLDSEAFQPSRENADDRMHLLGYFNSVCRFAGLRPPPLEPKLAVAMMPRPLSGGEKSMLDDLVQHVREQVEDNDGNDGDDGEKLLGLVSALEFLPQMFGYNAQEAVIAQIRYKLTLLGKDAPLPYGPKKVDGGIGQSAPHNSVSVLIVDDHLPAITRTAVAISGWPGMEIDFVQFSDLHYKTEVLAEVLAELVQQILDKKPDIVLMDQTMHYLRGSDVIRAINRIVPKSKIIFIGNTGGDFRELDEVGAFGNCEKGTHLLPLIQMVSCF